MSRPIVVLLLATCVTLGTGAREVAVLRIPLSFGHLFVAPWLSNS